MDEDVATGVEAAIFGPISRSEIDSWQAQALAQSGAGRLAEALFHAGRIDAVYGVVTDDGHQLVIKVHRPPVDYVTRVAVTTAQKTLAAAGFPCAEPGAGPLRVDGHVVTVETLLDEGRPGDAHDPDVRRAVAAGLAEQLAILGDVPGLEAAAPAWCRYQDGPWPTPHDTVFDFSATPAGFAWLDSFARRASSRLLVVRADEQVVTGHADWYCGNLRFDGARLVASFDWDLVSDAAAVIAGITAGGFTGGSTSGPETPTPDEVAVFLVDFEQAYGRAFTREEQRLAAAGAAWNMAYGARCDLSNFGGEPAAGSALEMVAERGDELLSLRW